VSDISSSAPASGSGASAPSSTPSSTPAAATSPSSGSGAGDGSSATPTPTATAGTPAQPSGGSGEPPRERWNDILDNARRKARQETQAEYQERYGRFEQDPWGAVQDWLDQASQHSVYGPLVNQWTTQRVAKSQPAAEEPQADIPVVDAQGNITSHTYSDKQLRKWQKWNQAQSQQELDQRLGSIEQQQQAWQQREQQAQIMQQAHNHVSQTLGGLRQQPYFKEHEADIREALAAHEEWGDNVHAAYNYVLTNKILPTLSQAEQRAVVDSINQKATGASISPRGTATGKPKFRNFKEAAAYYEAHPEEAGAMAQRP
jgi:hypothetical protein